MTFNKSSLLTCITATLCLLLSLTSHAREISRDNIKIIKIHMVGYERPAEPRSQGITRVYVDSKDWEASGDCRKDAIDISAQDAHLRDLLVSAWNNRRRVDVTLETDLTPMHDKVCQLVNLSVSKW